MNKKKLVGGIILSIGIFIFFYNVSLSILNFKNVDIFNISFQIATGAMLFGAGKLIYKG